MGFKVKILGNVGTTRTLQLPNRANIFRTAENEFFEIMTMDGPDATLMTASLCSCSAILPLPKIAH